MKDQQNLVEQGIKPGHINSNRKTGSDRIQWRYMYQDGSAKRTVTLKPEEVMTYQQAICRSHRVEDIDKSLQLYALLSGCSAGSVGQEATAGSVTAAA